MKYYLTCSAQVMIVTLLTYSFPAHSSYNKTQINQLNRLQRRAKKIISVGNIFDIDQQLKRECVMMVKKCLNSELNCDIFNTYFKLSNHKFQTRNNNQIVKLPPVKLETAKRGFFFNGGSLYNALPLEIRKIRNMKQFSRAISKHCF